MAVYAWHYSSMACTLLGPQGEKARRIKMSNELLVPVLRQRCAAAVVMHVCTLLLAGLVTQYELNGLNSELGTFLVLACAGELARNAAAPPPPPPPPHHHHRAAAASPRPLSARAPAQPGSSPPSPWQAASSSRFSRHTTCVAACASSSSSSCLWWSELGLELGPQSSKQRCARSRQAEFAADQPAAGCWWERGRWGHWVDLDV